MYCLAQVGNISEKEMSFLFFGFVFQTILLAYKSILKKSPIDLLTFKIALFSPGKAMILEKGTILLELRNRLVK